MEVEIVLLIKLLSALVHFDEYNSSGGHPIDLQMAQQLMANEDVKDFMRTMQKQAFIPLRRSGTY